MKMLRCDSSLSTIRSWSVSWADKTILSKTMLLGTMCCNRSRTGNPIWKPGLRLTVGMLLLCELYTLQYHLILSPLLTCQNSEKLKTAQMCIWAMPRYGFSRIYRIVLSGLLVNSVTGDRDCIVLNSAQRECFWASSWEMRIRMLARRIFVMPKSILWNITIAKIFMRKL